MLRVRKRKNLSFLPGNIVALLQKSVTLHQEAVSVKKSKKDEIRRVNELQIQMLSKPLHEQLFRDKAGTKFYTEDDVIASKEHLESHNLLKPGTEKDMAEDVNVKLPPLYKNDLAEHFKIIAAVQSQAYLDLAMDLYKSKTPPMPVEWAKRPGWTKYNPITGAAEEVECPIEDALVFDVETCVMDKGRPILAVALGTNHWYSWASKQVVCTQPLLEDEDVSLDDLIPLEPADVAEVDSENGPASKCRLVVGHHVGFDRSKIREQYFMKKQDTKFLDTIGLHVTVSGLSNVQKGRWLGESKRRSQPCSRFWMRLGSPNNLAAVHGLHVKDSKVTLDKNQRNIFVEGSVKDIVNDFQNLTQYCATDVYATKEILQKLLPLFLEQCPHPVSFAGMLEMGSAYMPLKSWKRFVDNSEFCYESLTRKVTDGLMEIAKNTCRRLNDESYRDCPWLCNLDWSVFTPRGKPRTKIQSSSLECALMEHHEKEEKGEFGDLSQNSKFIICDMKGHLQRLKDNVEKSPSKSCSSRLPNYPKWYKGLFTNQKYSKSRWLLGSPNIKPAKSVTPYLLKMKWQGHPVHRHSKLGWGYIIDPDTETTAKDVDFSKCYLEKDTAEQIQDVSNLLDSMPMDEKIPLKSKKRKVKRFVIRENVVPSAEWKEQGSEWGDVDLEETVEVIEEDGEEFQRIPTPWGITNDVVELPNNKTYYFFKLPHMMGNEKNVGNPLSKDFLRKLEDGTLTSSAGRLGRDCLEYSKMIGFWRSSRNRIFEQFVVHTDGFIGRESDKKKSDVEATHVIIPAVMATGTVSRRAVEATWLTASNARQWCVGSEVKICVQAPPGYHLVGADVDSQELWISSILADQYFTKIHGGTAIGWMVTQGNKVDGTDVHSLTAKTVGIEREDAKVINYSRIYGAGVKFIISLLKLFKPSLTEEEVRAKGREIMQVTKGRRGMCLNEAGVDLANEMRLQLGKDNVISTEDWNLLKSVVNINYESTNMLVEKQMWMDGTESHLFNKLEDIVFGDDTKTPFLGCRISRALQGDVADREFQTTRLNWVVQSSAVDYLHLLLTCTRWLFDYYRIEGRYCISIHDEVRYLVKSEDRYRAALALQYANLFTRAMFSYQLGMYDLPQSTAFFSTVEIDKVLRKDPFNNCVTPSNPEGLDKGHGIPAGEALNIYELIDKTNGSLWPTNS